MAILRYIIYARPLTAVVGCRGTSSTRLGHRELRLSVGPMLKRLRQCDLIKLHLRHKQTNGQRHVRLFFWFHCLFVCLSVCPLCLSGTSILWVDEVRCADVSSKFKGER